MPLLGNNQPGLEVAEAALQGNTPQIALQVAENVLSRNPHNAKALCIKGDALTTLGRMDEAGAAYSQALQIDSGSTRAKTGLGRLQLASNPASAETLFLDVLRVDPRDVTALNDLGVARDLQGQHEGAQEAYRQALGINPDLSSARVNMALSMAMSGRGSEAIQLIKPLATNPGATRKMHHDYAAVLTMAGDRPEAERVLAKDLPPAEVRQALDAYANATARPTVGGAAAASPVVLAPMATAEAARPAPSLTTGAATQPHEATTPQASPAEADRSAQSPPPMETAQSVQSPPAAASPQPAATSSAITRAAPSAQSALIPTVIAPVASDTAPPAEQAATPVQTTSAAQPAHPVPPSAVAAPATSDAAARVEPAMKPVRSVASAPPAQPVSTPSMEVSAQSGAAVRVEPAAVSVLSAPPTGTTQPPPMTAPARSDVAARVEPPAVSVQPASSARPVPTPSTPKPAQTATLAQPETAKAPTQIASSAQPPLAVSRPDAAPPTPQAPGDGSGQPASSSQAGPSGPQVQLTASPTEAAARALWQRLEERYPAILAAHTPLVLRVDHGDQTFWRLRTAGFANAAEAHAFCGQLQANGAACVVTGT